MKKILSNLLRKLGLLYLADHARFFIEKRKNSKANKAFKNEHPNVKLPPDYLIYESFQMSYKKYYIDSQETARKMWDIFTKYVDLKNASVLDWGCGPARIIRHLSTFSDGSTKFYGTDYNANSIAWNKANIENVEFNLNTLEAKLPYADNMMDVIYGISIFTHLSEPAHYEWFNELYRVLKPGGIMYLTAQGEATKIKLSSVELEQFNKGELVVRGKVKEGHRTYSAFQPKDFMQKLFSNMTIVEHVEAKWDGVSAVPQDVWIVRK